METTMNERWMNGLVCMACAVLLAACPQDSKSEPELADAAAVDDVVDASQVSDAGSEPRPSDAGQKPTDQNTHDKLDSGVSEHPDAAPPAPKPSEDPAPAPTDAGRQPPAPDAGGQPNAGPSVQHFFLPTPEPENTTAPKLEVDANGGTHMLYPGYAGGDAYYAYCPKDCSGPAAVKVIRLKTDGTVANAMLRLTAAGKPRVLLSTFQRVHYAQCDDQCSDESHWTNSVIVEHGSDRDVSGNAFALDPQGRPRFVMHAYLAYLGVGQKTPQTWFAQCDESCNDASRWRIDLIQDDIWYASQLRYDAQGRAHLLTGVVTTEANGPTYKLAAYFICEKDCTSAAAWSGIGLAPLFESQVEEIRPSLTMALTKTGQPRVLTLGTDQAGKRRLLYFECDADCANDHWAATSLSDHPQLGSGLDMVLDAQNRPRFVFTLDDNIGLHYCESDHCTVDDAPWNLTKIEYAGEVPKDNIILWPNCSVDAWLLHDPSLTLLPDGSARVGYQATDISGGFTTSDPTQPACVAGKDMTLSRLSVLGSYK
jgi:hypothetical protein